MPCPWSVPLSAFCYEPPAEFAHDHHGEILCVVLRTGAVEVGVESVQTSRQLVQKDWQVVVLTIMGVPPAEIDGRHVQTQIELHHPGDDLQMIAKAGLGIDGAIGWNVLPGDIQLDHVDGIERLGSGDVQRRGLESIDAP